jgi:hypothetical protein
VGAVKIVRLTVLQATDSRSYLPKPIRTADVKALAAYLESFADDPSSGPFIVGCFRIDVALEEEPQK